MEYGEAIQVLERAKEKFEFPIKWGIDRQSEHERYLTEKHAKKPVIVMNYPKAIKAFYMRVNDDGRTVAAMDVLAPGIDGIIGSSQRDERREVLDARMAERGIDREHYAPTLRSPESRSRQCARHDPVSANPRKRAVLTRTTLGREFINGRLRSGAWLSVSSPCASGPSAPPAPPPLADGCGVRRSTRDFSALCQKTVDR
jgi:tRNA synthetase class II (D, K and N)